MATTSDQGLWAALLTIPTLRRANHRFPFAFSMSLVAVGFLARYDLLILTAAGNQANATASGRVRSASARRPARIRISAIRHPSP